MSHITNIQRNFILDLVIICGLLGYPTVVLLTALDINPRDPLYYETEYNSTYDFSINGEFDFSANFTSEMMTSSVSNATLIGSTVEKHTLVSVDGKWINTTGGSTESSFYLPFWFFIENPIQETLKGESGAHSPERVYLVDPWGFFGPVNTTYTLKFIEFYIEPFQNFATQVSNLYDVYINETDTKVGQALYDTTCGLMWWFDVYNTDTGEGVRAELTETTFIISRNRFFYMYSMLFWFAIGLLFFAFRIYWKKYEKEQIFEMLLLMGLGFAAFFLDGILDIWFTNMKPMLFAVHGAWVLATLILTWKDRHWRIAIIPLLEFAMVAVMIFFHGTFDLVFTFCPMVIAGWLALMADVRGRMRGDQIEPVNLDRMKEWFKRVE